MKVEKGESAEEFSELSSLSQRSEGPNTSTFINCHLPSSTVINSRPHLTWVSINANLFLDKFKMLTLHFSFSFAFQSFPPVLKFWPRTTADYQNFTTLAG